MDNNSQQPEQPAATQSAQNWGLDLGSVFKNCWRYFTENLGVYIGLYAVQVLIAFLVLIPVFAVIAGAESFDPTGDFVFNGETEIQKILISIFIAMIVILILSARVIASLYAVSIKIMQENVRPSFGEAWRLGAGQLGKVVAVSIVTGVAILVGFIFLVIPGIIAMLMFFVSIPVAIEKKLSTGDALKESARLTKGNRGQILLVIFILGIISSLLDIVPVIGEIASLILGIVIWIVPAYIYVALKHQKGDTTTPVTGMPAPTGGMPPVNESTPPTSSN